MDDEVGLGELYYSSGKCTFGILNLMLGLTLSRSWGKRTSPSDVYPAGKLPRHFIIVGPILGMVYDCHL